MSVETDSTLLHINKTPDEILEHILSFLDVQERFKMEQVCRRWQWLSTVHHWRTPKKLIFDATSMHKTPMRGKWVLTDSALLKILSRCGSALRHITIVKSTLFNYDYKICVTPRSVGIIAKYCRNLTEIEIVGVPLTKTILKKLAKGCRKLQTVRLSDYDEKCYDDLRFSRWCANTDPLANYDGDGFIKYHLKQDEISAFLKRCKSLESLTLHLDHFGQKRCFKLDSKKLKTLRIRHVDPNFFKRVFEVELFINCECLQELRLNNCSVEPEWLLPILHRFRNTLRILDLRDFARPHIMQRATRCARAINWCEVLRMLGKLEELYIFTSGVDYNYMCHMSEECFAIISKHLRILAVTHSGFNEVGNVRFITKLLEGCHRLQELYLYCFTLSPKIFKLCIRFVDTLKVLALSECQLTTEGQPWLRDFCALTRNLEVAYFREQDRITDNVLKMMFNPSNATIRVLNLSGASITDVGLSHLSCLKCLVALSVTGCFSVTDKGIRTLAADGRLEEFYVQPGSVESVNNVTDNGCIQLANRCPNLRILDVTCRENVTNKLVTAFCDSIKRGFLVHRVSLFADYTSITANHERHSRLDVLRNSNSYNYNSLTDLRMYQ